MFRYIFQLTLMRFNSKVCGINSESVLVSTKRLEELITHGLLHCTSDWQYKDEVYEGVKLFFDDVVVDGGEKLNVFIYFNYYMKELNYS